MRYGSRLRQRVGLRIRATDIERITGSAIRCVLGAGSIHEALGVYDGLGRTAYAKGKRCDGDAVEIYLLRGSRRRAVVCEYQIDR